MQVNYVLINKTSNALRSPKLQEITNHSPIIHSVAIDWSVWSYIRSVRVFSVRRRQKSFQTRSRERIDAIKNSTILGAVVGRIGVVLSRCLAFLRTKELCSLFRSNEGSVK